MTVYHSWVEAAEQVINRLKKNEDVRNIEINKFLDDPSIIIREDHKFIVQEINDEDFLDIAYDYTIDYLISIFYEQNENEENSSFAVGWCLRRNDQDAAILDLGTFDIPVNINDLEDIENELTILISKNCKYTLINAETGIINRDDEIDQWDEWDVFIDWELNKH